MEFDIEFWNQDCEEFFKETHKDFIKHGYSEEESQELMERFYSMVSAEYGN